MLAGLAVLLALIAATRGVYAPAPPPRALANVELVALVLCAKVTAAR